MIDNELRNAASRIVARRFGQPIYELNDALKAVDLFYGSPEMRMKKETFQEATNRVLGGMFEPSMVDESTDGTTAMLKDASAHCWKARPAYDETKMQTSVKAFKKPKSDCPPSKITSLTREFADRIAKTHSADPAKRNKYITATWPATIEGLWLRDFQEECRAQLTVQSKKTFLREAWPEWWMWYQLWYITHIGCTTNREHYDLLVMKLDGRHVPEAKLA